MSAGMKPAEGRAATGAPFDPERRYVRVLRERADGFVEFEFAVGEPGVFIEMVLRPDAFEDFCATHDIVRLAPRAETVESGPPTLDWRLSEAVERGIHSR